MKAITTKFHGPTNVKGSRYSARDSDNNRVILNSDFNLDHEENHKRAALALVSKMGWEGTFHGGSTKDGFVWVCVPSHSIGLDFSTTGDAK